MYSISKIVMSWGSILCCCASFSLKPISDRKRGLGPNTSDADPGIEKRETSHSPSLILDRNTKQNKDLYQSEEEPISPLFRTGTARSVPSLRRVPTARSFSSSLRIFRRNTNDKEEMYSIDEPWPPRNLSSEVIARKMILGRFFSDDLLDDTVRETVVQAMLAEFNFKTDLSILTEFICKHARRVFMILAYSEQMKLAEHFFNHQFHDGMLPVTTVLRDKNSWNVNSLAAEFDSLSIVRSTFSSGIWSYRNANTFCNSDQWYFVIPVFRAGQFRYQFHEESRMPFVDEHFKSQKTSNFSTVEEWRIHRSHLKIGDTIGVPKNEDDHPSVALKELKKVSQSEEDFRKAAETEAQTLEMLIKLNHPHLIKAIAYYTIGKKHFFMFPWAGLGNLRDFWKTDPPKLDQPYLKWVFSQLCGLAEAIKKLHHWDDNKEESWRHGDLKPDNILCFKYTSGIAVPSGPCMLVIADVGLTKKHHAATEDRKNATRTLNGTVMYEPPEAELRSDQPRSRRYDIWSIGCIYLEFIIWLLYGSSELERFRTDLRPTRQFYMIEENRNTSDDTAKLHNMVRKWVEWIKSDPRCPENSALCRLTELIVSKLLVMDDDRILLKPRRQFSWILEQESKAPLDNSAPPSPSIIRTSTKNDFSGLLGGADIIRRANAEDLDIALKKIFKDTESGKANYFKWMDFDVPSRQGPGQFGERLAASDAKSLAVKGESKEQEVRIFLFPLDDNWEYAADTEIARDSLSYDDLQLKLPRKVTPSELCYRCAAFELWRPKFGFLDTPAALRKRAWLCKLCKLLVRHIHDTVTEDNENVQFIRVGSSLACSLRPEQPVVSLYTLPVLGSEISSSGIQHGFPELSSPGSESHVRVLAAWIQSCNDAHDCISGHDSFLPTRVLDVSYAEPHMVRLVCHIQDHEITGKYVALSHRWGSSIQHRKFCTFDDNIEKYRIGIRVGELPKTFQDAVQVTRSLGLQYLWIDSLCIIQDNPEDWDHESKLMEQVFSSAYLTIAATCADGTDDGFLKARPTRYPVTIRKDKNSVYYACDAIDHFHEDVDQGELNMRGWVLQERALSRRTIHFTRNQSYWECGGGVRCETLTMMKNRKAAFLGDANFPHSVESYVKGMKIELFQDLYSRYSNLALSFKADRPIAIRGLEKRLIRTLNTIGGYGVFNIYMHRCLLWKRSGASLTRIPPVREMHGRMRGEIAPSWSWMAYDGGIEYMDIPYGRVAWSEDIISPFHGKGLEDTGVMNSEELPTEVEAPIWHFTDAHSAEIVFDESDRVIENSLQCVIVGTQLGMSYVLIVTLSNKGFYERAGVGILKSTQIPPNQPRRTVRIQ
ncbi:HET-domain-containing protein [Corynespora cassiicola Philippines]|uniref:HET-domain-containing protein n=1 Tax=Corynespora cassiicola Philippines TaxID=1448308 RepID=A0A2T2P7T0_CORCC|nr:HET-domain-containing protein [Corynespora cassiicola Philippines]